MYRILYCLPLLCSFCSSLSAAHFIRHFRGVVLDTQTKAPVADVRVTAIHHPFILVTIPFYLPENDSPVGSTVSRKDGSFDLEVAADQPDPSYLEAGVAEPRLARSPYREEHVGAYQGTLKHISERRSNTVLIQKAYNLSIYEFPPNLTTRSSDSALRSGR